MDAIKKYEEAILKRISREDKAKCYRYEHISIYKIVTIVAFPYSIQVANGIHLNITVQIKSSKAFLTLSRSLSIAIAE